MSEREREREQYRYKETYIEREKERECVWKRTKRVDVIVCLKKRERERAGGLLLARGIKCNTKV